MLTATVSPLPCRLGWIVPKWREEAVHALLDELNPQDEEVTQGLLCLSYWLAISGDREVGPPIMPSILFRMSDFSGPTRLPFPA